MYSNYFNYQPLLITLTLVTGINTVSADNWSITPRIDTGVTYNDNIRLEPSNEVSETGIQIKPSVVLSRKTEISAIDLNLSADSRQYFGGSEYDSNDVFISLNMKRNTERSQYGLGINLSSFASITGEELDTGLLNSGQERDSISVSPSYRYTLDPKQSIMIAYSYTSTEYSSGPGSLVGYTNNGINGGYFYKSSPKNTFDISFSSSNFETDDNLTDTDSISLSLGVDHAFSETLSGRFSVGTHTTDSTVSGVNFDSSGTIVSLDLTKKRAKTTYNASISRSLVPSGAGQVNESDRVGLTWQHQYTKKIGLNLALNHIQNKSVLGFGSTTDREYTSFTPSVSWRLTEKMNLNFMYQYAKQKYDTDTEDAESNSFRVSLQYFWNPTQVLK